MKNSSEDLLIFYEKILGGLSEEKKRAGFFLPESLFRIF